MEYIKNILVALLDSFRLLLDSVVTFLSGGLDILSGVSEIACGLIEIVGSIIAICFPFFALWVLFILPIKGVKVFIREKKKEEKKVEGKNILDWRAILWLAPLFWIFVAFLLIFAYPALISHLIEK